MKELKRVAYTGFYRKTGKKFDIWIWEGTPLNVVWNSMKGYFLAGDTVSINDNQGHYRIFTKGLI